MVVGLVVVVDVVVVVVVVVLVVELDALAGGSVAPYLTAPSPRIRPKSCVILTDYVSFLIYLVHRRPTWMPLPLPPRHVV